MRYPGMTPKCWIGTALVACGVRRGSSLGALLGTALLVQSADEIDQAWRERTGLVRGERDPERDTAGRDRVEESSRESFPASDPPATY
jgi:hypothetical protein